MWQCVVDEDGLAAFCNLFDCPSLYVVVEDEVTVLGLAGRFGDLCDVDVW